MPSQALQSEGILVQLSTTAVTNPAVDPEPTYASLTCVLRGIGRSAGSRTENDASTLCSTAKEYRMGLKDNGTYNATGFWNDGDAGYAAVLAASDDGTNTYLLKVTFPNGSVEKALVYVNDVPWDAPVDGLITSDFTMRVTGAIVREEA